MINAHWGPVNTEQAEVIAVVLVGFVPSLPFA